MIPALKNPLQIIGILPPPIFNAIAATSSRNSELVGTFLTREECNTALNQQLEDWHEGIAFESDIHHKLLDHNFNAFSRIEEI